MYNGIQLSLLNATSKTTAYQKLRDQRKIFSKKLYAATKEEDVKGAIDSYMTAKAEAKKVLLEHFNKQVAQTAEY